METTNRAVRFLLLISLMKLLSSTIFEENPHAVFHPELRGWQVVTGKGSIFLL